MNKYSFSTWVFRISILALTGVTFIPPSFYEVVVTKLWHLRHDSYRYLGNIKVTVPEDMIIPRPLVPMETFDKFNMDKVDFENPSVFLSFTRFYETKDFEDSFTFKKFLKTQGHTEVKDLSCNILGQECEWLQSYDGQKTIDKYRETIFFKKEKIWITYRGNPEERIHFLNVISKLKYDDSKKPT